MSILIKGMELPKDCEECRFCIGLADTEWGTCAGCLIDNEYREASSKSGCPLIEISEPHGRLIDASYKVDMPFYDDEYEEHSMRTVTVEELLMMADNDVPTVIEAEGSEEDERYV